MIVSLNSINRLILPKDMYCILCEAGTISSSPPPPLPKWHKHHLNSVFNMLLLLSIDFCTNLYHLDEHKYCKCCHSSEVIYYKKNAPMFLIFISVAFQQGKIFPNKHTHFTLCNLHSFH
jgi:hypothetical protein